MWRHDFLESSQRKRKSAAQIRISNFSPVQTENWENPTARELERERKCAKVLFSSKKNREKQQKWRHTTNYVCVLVCRTQRTFDFACNWAYERDFCIWALLEHKWKSDGRVGYSTEGPGPGCPVWILPSCLYPLPLNRPFLAAKKPAEISSTFDTFTDTERKTNMTTSSIPRFFAK